MFLDKPRRITIPTRIICAAVHCVGKKDIRPALQGALFEYTANESALRVISTDGGCLTAFRVTTPEQDGESFAIVVPLATLKKVEKTKAPDVVLELGAYSLGGELFTPIDQPFPAWRRTIPELPPTNEPGEYDPALLLRAHLAFREATGENGRMQQNGVNSAVVIHNGQDDALAIVMPMRWYSKSGEYVPPPAYKVFK